MTVVPKEFEVLCLQFQIATLSYFGSPEKMIANALAGTPKIEKVVIGAFLTSLLDGEPDLPEITSIWLEMPMDFFLPVDDEMLMFLELLKKLTIESLDE